MDRHHPGRIVTAEEREAVEQQLADLFARDQLELAEYEERVERIVRAETHEELAALTSDLAPPGGALVPTSPTAVEPSDEGRPVAPTRSIPRR